MFFERNTHTIRIGMTVVELQNMQAYDERLYATPTLVGEANHIYQASAPMYRDDFVVANVTDFLEEVGWTDLGDAQTDEEIQITVPRSRVMREA